MCMCMCVCACMGACMRVRMNVRLKKTIKKKRKNAFLVEERKSGSNECQNHLKLSIFYGISNFIDLALNEFYLFFLVCIN